MHSVYSYLSSYLFLQLTTFYPSYVILLFIFPILLCMFCLTVAETIGELKLLFAIQSNDKSLARDLMDKEPELVGIKRISYFHGNFPSGHFPS